jgi:hypothetical protein
MFKGRTKKELRGIKDSREAMFSSAILKSLLG